MIRMPAVRRWDLRVPVFGTAAQIVFQRRLSHADGVRTQTGSGLSISHDTERPDPVLVHLFCECSQVSLDGFLR